MSFSDGWAAVNLDMPARIPRVEFDAESHWSLVEAVTGIRVSPESPEEEQNRARRAFVRAWNYDILLNNLINIGELRAKCTSMGHSQYAAGGVDYDANVRCPFRDPEEVFALDPWETYGTYDRRELVARFNQRYREECEAYPDLVNMTGTYVTLFSGLIAILGWDMLLTAGGLEPDRLGDLANRYASWMQQFYDALAESETPVIYTHDDIVWTAGAVFHPAWYRKYIFPNYRKLFAPLREAGKKPIFISDGDYTEFIDDVAASGASGFFLEPLTDLRHIVEHYGKTHIIIGNADTRILLSGSKPDIRREVERCIALGRNCPGYFMGVTNMIPANTPVKSALYYNDVYMELSRR
jgi:uroporphyrinogen-III decarboxylase